MMKSLQTLSILIMGVALAACQSVPKKPSFTAAQVKVLQEEGFVAADESWQLTLPSRLLFSSDASQLDAEKLSDLAELSANLVRVGIRTAVIEGHTDSTASDDYNLKLSQARAQNVAAPMSNNGMIFAPTQIIGRGEGFPISSNDTPEGRQDNRRVVIIVHPQ